MKRKKRKKRQFPNPFNDETFRDHFAEAWTEVKKLMEGSPDEMLDGPWPVMGRLEARVNWLSRMCLQVARHRMRLCVENRDISAWAMSQTFADLANRIDEADLQPVPHEQKETTDEA